MPRGQVGDPLCRGRPSTFDEVATWQVEDPVVVATRSGDRARDATAHKGDRVWIVFVVADGSSTMTATLLAPESTWVTLRDDVEEMAASIALPEEAP